MSIVMIDAGDRPQVQGAYLTRGPYGQPTVGLFVGDEVASRKLKEFEALDEAGMAVARQYEGMDIRDYRAARYAVSVRVRALGPDPGGKVAAMLADEQRQAEEQAAIVAAARARASAISVRVALRRALARVRCCAAWRIYGVCLACGNLVYREPGKRHDDGQVDTDESPVWLFYGDARGSKAQIARLLENECSIDDVDCGCCS